MDDHRPGYRRDGGGGAIAVEDRDTEHLDLVVDAHGWEAEIAGAHTVGAGAELVGR